VDVAQIIACLLGNAERAKGLIKELAGLLKGERAPSPIDTALDNALITAPHARDPALMEKLQVVAGRALGR
jgi:5'-methylthioadenosine phosphorylase